MLESEQKGAPLLGRTVIDPQTQLGQWRSQRPHPDLYKEIPFSGEGKQGPKVMDTNEIVIRANLGGGGMFTSGWGRYSITAHDGHKEGPDGTEDGGFIIAKVSNSGRGGSASQGFVPCADISSISYQSSNNPTSTHILMDQDETRGPYWHGPARDAADWDTVIIALSRPVTIGTTQTHNIQIQPCSNKVENCGRVDLWRSGDQGWMSHGARARNIPATSGEAVVFDPQHPTSIEGAHASQNLSITDIAKWITVRICKGLRDATHAGERDELQRVENAVHSIWKGEKAGAQPNPNPALKGITKRNLYNMTKRLARRSRASPDRKFRVPLHTSLDNLSDGLDPDGLLEYRQMRDVVLKQYMAGIIRMFLELVASPQKLCDWPKGSGVPSFPLCILLGPESGGLHLSQAIIQKVSKIVSDARSPQLAFEAFAKGKQREASGYERTYRPYFDAAIRIKTDLSGLKQPYVADGAPVTGEMSAEYTAESNRLINQAVEDMIRNAPAPAPGTALQTLASEDLAEKVAGLGFYQRLMELPSGEKTGGETKSRVGGRRRRTRRKKKKRRRTQKKARRRRRRRKQEASLKQRGGGNEPLSPPPPQNWLILNNAANINAFKDSDLPLAGKEGGRENLIEAMSGAGLNGGYWIVEWNQKRPQSENYGYYHLAFQNEYPTQLDDLLPDTTLFTNQGGGTRHMRKKRGGYRKKRHSRTTKKALRRRRERGGKARTCKRRRVRRGTDGSYNEEDLAHNQKCAEQYMMADNSWMSAALKGKKHPKVPGYGKFLRKAIKKNTGRRTRRGGTQIPMDVKAKAGITLLLNAMKGQNGGRRTRRKHR